MKKETNAIIASSCPVLWKSALRGKKRRVFFSFVQGGNEIIKKFLGLDGFWLCWKELGWGMNKKGIMGREKDWGACFGEEGGKNVRPIFDSTRGGRERRLSRLSGIKWDLWSDLVLSQCLGQALHPLKKLHTIDRVEHIPKWFLLVFDRDDKGLHEKRNLELKVKNRNRRTSPAVLHVLGLLH